MVRLHLCVGLAVILLGWLLCPLANAAGAAPEVWYSPDPHTPDFTTMFAHPELWSRARARIHVFEFSPQQTMGRNHDGINTSDDLAKVDAFRKLRSWGIETAIATGAIKEWDCTGQRAAQVTLKYIDVVRSQGGLVDTIAMDEPLIGGIINCKSTLADTALKTSAYMRQIRSAAPDVTVGDIEPYPTFSAAQLIEFVRLLVGNGTRPAYFHLDVNIPVLQFRPNVHLEDDLRTLQTFLRGQGIPFGIIIWSGYNPDPTDQAYYDRAMAWAKRVHDAVGVPDHLDFASWVFRSSRTCAEGQRDCTPTNPHCTAIDPPYCGEKSLPLNLPDNDPAEFSHTRLVLDALRLFEPGPGKGGR
jgi:hypothetical protein